MFKEIKIEQTEQFTIYIVGNNKFRIVQIHDLEFIIQKLYKKTITEGCLWWEKTITTHKWHRVDINGKKYNIENYDQFLIYNTLEKAIKWIEDYNKYPIYW